MRGTTTAISLLVITLVACTTSSTIDTREPKRVVGREENVRLDAQILDDRLSPSSLIHVRYTIENLRPDPIAIADLMPGTTFDSDTRMITLTIGSEVPGNQFLPRLLLVASGETKSFDATTRLTQLPPMAGPLARTPQQLRVELAFLSTTKPFEKLIGIPERAISDPALATELFQPWIENSVTVYSNAIPIEWGAAAPSPVQRRFQ